MALSEKQKQKKLLKKKQKRTAAVKTSKTVSQRIGAADYAGYPVHECFMVERLFEDGIGEISLARKLPDGNLAVSLFLVDVFCLGVKNAFFALLPALDYENLKSSLLERGDQLETIEPECAKKLVEGAAAYAKNLGFNPNPDYKSAAALFGSIEASACETAYAYGKDNKPLYIRGPDESLSQAKRIVNALHNKCGEGGFDFHLELDGF